MFSSHDLCPHGLMLNECDVCRYARNIKPNVKLVEDKSTYEFEVEYPKYKDPVENAIDKKLLVKAHSLESRVKPLTRPGLVSRELHSEQKSIFDQQKDLTEKNNTNSINWDPTQELINIEKKFLTKK